MILIWYTFRLGLKKLGRRSEKLGCNKSNIGGALGLGELKF
jgi:hypothetical protein